MDPQLCLGTCVLGNLVSLQGFDFRFGILLFEKEVMRGLGLKESLGGPSPGKVEFLAHNVFYFGEFYSFEGSRTL